MLRDPPGKHFANVFCSVKSLSDIITGVSSQFKLKQLNSRLNDVFFFSASINIPAVSLKPSPSTHSRRYTGSHRSNNLYVASTRSNSGNLLYIFHVPILVQKALEVVFTVHDKFYNCSLLCRFDNPITSSRLLSIASIISLDNVSLLLSVLFYVTLRHPGCCRY